MSALRVTAPTWRFAVCRVIGKSGRFAPRALAATRKRSRSFALRYLRPRASTRVNVLSVVNDN